MKRTSSVAAAVLAGAVVSAGSRAASGAPIVYLQNFSATSGMSALSTVDWSAYYGSATTPATLATAGSSGVPANAMLSGGPSAPTDGPNVNATQTTAGTSTGFVPLLSANGADQFLLETGEDPLDPAVQTPATFNWYAGSAYAGDAQQLAVEIGGQWYVSTLADAVPAGATNGMLFSTTAQRFTVNYDPAAGDWDALDFAVGSPLTVGPATTAALPAGPITNFGVYATIADNSGTSVTNERTYVDSFEVTATAVPEPASAGLVVAAAMTLRRRRRAAP